MKKPLWPILMALACACGLAGHAAPQDDEDPSDTPGARPPNAGVVPFDAEAAGRLQDACARHLSVEKAVTKAVGMPLILIPPGKFRMWGEDVTVPDAFYLGRTEVTQAQWSAVMGTTPWKDQAPEGGHRPATFVSWNEAQAFCRRLTEQERDGVYRLPTEAEWEFACRAGTATSFSFGDDASLLGQFAWNSANTRDAGEPHAHDVALKKPNPFGLFDMHGNVWEYCDGEYFSDPNKEERPRLAKAGHLRVAAGGSWFADLARFYPGSDPDLYCRSDGRFWPTAEYVTDDMGFRVAWTPPVKEE